MFVSSVTLNNDKNVTFGYSNILKTLWKRHKLPTVIYDFYGDILTEENVTLEHLKAKSCGGKSDLSNFVLSSKRKNNARGNRPLEDVLDISSMIRYLNQFRGVRVGRFNGDRYIAMILDTVNRLVKTKGIISIHKGDYYA